MEWYYAKHGKQDGPVDLATLQGKLQGGELLPTDLVWKDGMPEWMAAGEVPELGAAPSADAPMAQAPVAQTPAQGMTPGSVPSARPAVTAPVAHVQVSNYLVPAILVTVLCCMPFGVPAIVFAAKVDGLVAEDDIAAAQHASDQAKLWCWIAGGFGALIYGFTFLVFFIAILNV